MFQYLSAVGVAAVIATTLMVAVMLYLVWGALNNDVHSPTPDTGDSPELGEGPGLDESTESSESVESADAAEGELTAEGNSA
ncbi:hypothetical protein [Halorubrum laminariae]|uniref:Uncharacterized protein n=1 Tax=Halorubrum laminariae TaxID=1433523 RepID=A0ABD6C0V5_9EURY|nr:hypothetical protein [Halorubrum laminariae]